VYWNIVARSKWLVVVGCLLGAVGGILTFRRQFPIPTPVLAAVEVGSVGEPLEPIEVIRGKFETVILPTVLLEHAKARGYGNDRYRIDVKVESSFVRFESTGVGQAIDDLKDLMRAATDALVEDHNQLLTRKRRTLEDAQARLERELAAIEAEEKFFPGRRERIKVATKLLEEQIEATRKLIAAMREQRATLLNAEARRTEMEQSLATAILLIDNDIQANLTRLGALEERLGVSTKVDVEALERAIVENERAQIEKRTEIDRVKRDLAFVRPTRVVILPTVGLQKAVAPWYRNVLIGAVVGCALGALAALLAEFMARAKADRQRGYAAQRAAL
jgi:predicted outer membrane lipoprotein